MKKNQVMKKNVVSEKKVNLVPPGLIKISKLALEAIKNGGIPSIIIDNSLKIAKAKEWPENVNLTVLVSPTSDIDKRLIAQVIDNMRKPNVDQGQVIVDFLKPHWVSKQKKVVVEEIQKKFSRPINQVKKVFKKKEVAAPTIIIKKHKKVLEQ